MTDVWAVVRVERATLVDDLRELTPTQWATPSLCDGWTVHDVLAHLVDSARSTRLGFVRDLIASRLDFDRLNQRGVDRERAGDPQHTLDRFAGLVDRTTTPPAPLASRLIEAIVHGEDIRRPLGIQHDYPAPAAVEALRSHAATSPSMGGGRALVQGLELRATDTEFALGEGPVAEGPVVSLLLAASGRRAALDEISGPGLSILRERIA